MSTRLQLAGNMIDCPVCWDNFVRHCQHVYNHGIRDWSVPDEIFDQELRKFGGQVHFGKDNYVDFESASDKTMFVLRWS